MTYKGWYAIKPKQPTNIYFKLLGLVKQFYFKQFSFVQVQILSSRS